MTNKQLKRYLLKEFPHLKKPLFGGDPIRLFDKEYMFDLPVGKLAIMVQRAMRSLEEQGFEPSEDYAENGADCDKWVRLILAECEKQWMKENEGKNSYPALPLGRWIAKGHALVFGLTEYDGLQIWNYGVLTQWDKNNCIEVEI